MMVENAMTSLVLEEMRNTAGFKIWLKSMRERYLSLVKTAYTNCRTAEEIADVRAGIRTIREALEYSGMSKEDVRRWMVIS